MDMNATETHKLGLDVKVPSNWETEARNAHKVRQMKRKQYVSNASNTETHKTGLNVNKNLNESSKMINTRP